MISLEYVCKEIFDVVAGYLLFLMCFNRKLEYSSMPTNF